MSKEYEKIFVRLRDVEEKYRLSYNKYIELEQTAEELDRKISELKTEKLINLYVDGTAPNWTEKLDQ